MSGECLKAWNHLPADRWKKIEDTRMSIPSNRRPSKNVVEIVARTFAGGFIDERGYVDLTFKQILELNRTLSIDRIEWAIKCLTDAGELITVRRSTQGFKGQPGRAPRRVFRCYNPKGLKDFREQKVVQEIKTVAQLSRAASSEGFEKFDFEANALLLKSSNPTMRMYGERALREYEALISENN